MAKQPLSPHQHFSHFDAPNEPSAFAFSALEMGTRIRAARTRAKLTAAGLGLRASIDKAALLRLERGINRDPGVRLLSRIALALGVSLDELVFGQGQVPTEIATARRDSQLHEIVRRYGELGELLHRLQRS